MKKIFTIDDFSVAFVSALGYGFGETISRLMGWPEFACMGVSFVLGMVLEEIISKIAFSEAVQKKPINRILTYVTFFLIFVTAHYVSSSRLGVSMLDYLKDQVVSVIVFPILGFIVNLLIRWYRIRKVREVYGNGSKGYVFDVKKEDIEEINKENQTVYGKYDADRAAKTRTGIYVGVKYKQTITYLGIPYAKPPVGELRWKAPEPLPSSEAVFEAVNFGASAIQVEHEGGILKLHRQSENCLSLNICTGAKKTKEKKPVLVVFHHGDFTYGGSADPLLYGTNFVENRDVVFVSFNYRLGIFGFIDFSEVPGGEAYPDALNLGLLDQTAALKWIKENIAAFGGDPDRIIVLGFESGATSIILLAASGLAKDLFQKAFVFNGNPILAYNKPEGARALAKSLLKETQTATMEELSHLCTDTLKDAAQKLWLNMCAPTCDGRWIPEDVYRALGNGAAAGIEFIIGIPSDENQVYRSFFGEQKFENLLSIAAESLRNDMEDSIANAVQQYLETRNPTTTELESESKLVEQFLSLCVYRTAAELSQAGNKVHLLYWGAKPLIEKLGSGSVDAIASFLGNSEAAQMYGNVMDADLSEVLQILLQKFIYGSALQLYNNEIKGIDAFDWEVFPKALIVSDERIKCDTIEDRLDEVKGLFELMAK